MTARAVEVDWSDVQQGIPRLVDGLEDGSRRAALDAATSTAAAIRARVPVLTGALASSVGVVDEPGGAVGVTYGEGLPYARYIEHRTGAVEAGVEGAPERFQQACEDMARREVRKL